MPLPLLATATGFALAVGDFVMPNAGLPDIVPATYFGGRTTRPFATAISGFAGTPSAKIRRRG